MKLEVALVGMLILLACSDLNEIVPDEIIIEERCTEWKSICIGDTVHFAFRADTATCVVTKIVYRRDTLGDLIGAKKLSGDGHLGADESHFKPITIPDTGEEGKDG